MNMLLFLSGVFAGLVIGSLIYMFKRTSGILRIDHSSPEKDLYRFEIDNLDNLSKKKYIILKIDNNADLSQK